MEFINGTFYTGTEFVGYLGINIIVIFNSTFSPAWAVYYPPSQDGSAIVGTELAQVPPFFLDPATPEALGTEWTGIINVPGLPPMLAATSLIAFEEGGTVYGTFIVAHHLEPVLSSFTDLSRVCITSWQENSSSLPADAREAFASLSKSSSGNGTDDWGQAEHLKHISGAVSSEGRFCPSYTNWSENAQAAYMLLRDPFLGHPEGPLIRVDHSRLNAEKGFRALAYIVVAIFCSLLVVAAAFVVFLDRSVLKRIMKLNTIISGSGSIFPALSEMSDESDRRRLSDEVRRLKTTLKSKMDSLGAEISKLRQGTEAEKKKAERIRGAMRMMNLLCRRNTSGRKREDTVLAHSAPGSPFATPHGSRAGTPRARSPVPSSETQQVATPVAVPSEPSIPLSGVLDDPFAVEFVKEHCSSEATSESLMFLIDMKHRRKLLEESPELCALWDLWIRSEYFAPDAPSGLNVGADAARAASQAGSFEAAEAEVSSLFRCDIMRRFTATPSFHSMQRVVSHETGRTTETEATLRPVQPSIFKQRRHVLPRADTSLTAAEVAQSRSPMVRTSTTLTASDPALAETTPGCPQKMHTYSAGLPPTRLDRPRTAGEAEPKTPPSPLPK